MAAVLWVIVALLVIAWLVGLFFHILGAAIHILLVLAIIVAIASFVFGSRLGSRA